MKREREEEEEEEEEEESISLLTSLSVSPLQSTDQKAWLYIDLSSAKERKSFGFLVQNKDGSWNSSDRIFSDVRSKAAF